MHRVRILGVPIDPISMEDAVARVTSMLQGSKQCHVMTPNSEMLVEAAHNQPFKDVLLRSDLNLPDSTGLLWAARRSGQRIPERVAGVDFVERLCISLCADCPVFLLGGRNHAAEGAAEKLRIEHARLPPACRQGRDGQGKLKIAGVYEGSPQDNDAAEIIRRVNNSGAKLLLVAYGAPAQDLWIAKHLSRMPSVRVAIGVGGTFDFLSGRARRAPMCMRQTGLEWLWRLVLQPRRIKRIFTATVVFPWMVLKCRSDQL